MNQILVVSLPVSRSDLADVVQVHFAVGVIQHLSVASHRVMNLAAVLLVAPVVWLTYIPDAIEDNGKRFFFS